MRLRQKRSPRNHSQRFKFSQKAAARASMMASVFRSFRNNPDNVSLMDKKCAQLIHQSRGGRLRGRCVLIEKKQFH